MAKYKIIPSSRTIVQSPISIGHKAEKGVEAIEFDVTAWVETYGSGTLTVIMRRWGDAIPYPIALEIDENNKATWTLSDTDTAKAGMAYAQLSYIVGDEVVKKSDIYTFRVMDSLTGEGDPPEAYESWLEHLTHLAAEAMAEVLDIKEIVTDKTLTVDGGIADAKATGDALSALEDQFTEETDKLKADIINYNSYDVFENLLTRKSRTTNGITYTWSGDVCTVAAGTASSYSVNVMLAPSMLPNNVKVGDKFYVKYSTTDSKVRLRIIFQTAADVDVETYFFESDAILTIPTGAEKWTIALFVSKDVVLSSNVTVSDIHLISAKTNDWVVNNGVIPTNTDLDTIKKPGIWVIKNGYVYTHNPLPAVYGGMMLVFKYSDRLILQIASTAGTGNVFFRASRAGNFPSDWGTGGAVNNYITENYENTYNITCSPTITTDTNNYLASTGDNTDRTGDIQTMLNTTGVCHLGAGKFVVTGVSVPDYAALIGSGDRTVIVLDDSVTSGYAVKLGNYSSIFGLRINGGSTAQGTSDSVGTRHGILFEGTKRPGQSGGATKKCSKIDKCTINNFTGGGITLTGTGAYLDSNLLISDCFVDHCGAGLYIPYYSEYHRICNCSFTYNYYGCVDNGGNNNFANCDFSGNKIGLLIDNSTDQSPNVAHGSFTNCSVNHSYSDGGVINEGTAIKLLKVNLGEIFTGMQIFYGAIIIDDCEGIRFIGANVGSKVPITITDSTVVTFSDCTFKDAPDHADSTFTQSGNTVLKFRDCYLHNGTAYNPMN